MKRKDIDYEALDKLIDDTFALDEQPVEDGNPGVQPETDVRELKDEALSTRQRQRLQD